MPPTNLLLGKTAIITGGTTGIGRAIALEYVRQGANVVVNHLALPTDAPHLASLLAEASAIRPGALHHLPGDVTDPEAGAALVARAASLFGGEGGGEGGGKEGRVDICVSNAGICTFADFLTLPGPLFTHTVATNLTGAFYVVQAAARHMAYANAPPGGAIIGVSSVSALVGGGRQAHYTPTKAGVLSLMQSCAVALGRHNIRCNALLPGTVRTQLNEGDLADEGKRGYMEGRIPLGRTGVPGDLAGPAVFLACEELSGYVTGAQLLVDGGLFVNLQ
ncbi:hypothetical protein F4825DRAFT_248911 [Nemania diffusa]|nr:hypothetical protein F4825DRAFT_248911 [Nemania diffusa]